MSPDPGLFLATIATVSAALVAIVGGLLVARFVGLDSDQRANQRARDAAQARLDSARSRAEQAHNDRIWWEAWDFLFGYEVFHAIGEGVTDLAELRRLATCPVADHELLPLINETAREIDAARQAMADNPPAQDELTAHWDGFEEYQKRVHNIKSSRAWRLVFDDKADEFYREREREREHERERRQRDQAERPQPSLFPGLKGIDIAGLSSILGSGTGGRSGPKLKAATSDTGARRYDEIQAEELRTQQRAEDYENELERLEAEHSQIAGPTGWLWTAVVILISFAMVGIVLPLWEMARGPVDLLAVKWVIWPFFGALAGLLGYMFFYLKRLTGRHAVRSPSSGTP
jgi:hypothetical protein